MRPYAWMLLYCFRKYVLHREIAVQYEVFRDLRSKNRCIMLFRRTSIRPVCNMTELMQALHDLRALRVLLMDVHPALVPWGLGSTNLDTSLRVLQGNVAHSSFLQTIVLVTNGPLQFSGANYGSIEIRVIPNAMKPWKLRNIMNVISSGQGDVAVCGDQLLTDGLLAWRLNAPFIHWVTNSTPPPRQAFLNFCAKKLRIPSAIFRQRASEDWLEVGLQTSASTLRFSEPVKLTVLPTQTALSGEV